MEQNIILHHVFDHGKLVNPFSNVKKELLCIPSVTRHAPESPGG